MQLCKLWMEEAKCFTTMKYLKLSFEEGVNYPARESLKLCTHRFIPGTLFLHGASQYDSHFKNTL